MTSRKMEKNYFVRPRGRVLSYTIKEPISYIGVNLNRMCNETTCIRMEIGASSNSVTSPLCKWDANLRSMGFYFLYKSSNL